MVAHPAAAWRYANGREPLDDPARRTGDARCRRSVREPHVDRIRGPTRIHGTALLTDDGETYYVNLETDPETHATERLEVRVEAKKHDYAVVSKTAYPPSYHNSNIPESPLSDSDVLVIAAGAIQEHELMVGG